MSSFNDSGQVKLHLTLPTARDQAARELEMKLVASSPDITISESLSLFQEVQDWLEGEPKEDFLVLRAFAAVLCGFHETKENLVQLQALLELTQARAEESQTELRRSLEQAQSPPPDPDMDDYKTKVLRTDFIMISLTIDHISHNSDERERQERAAVDRIGNQYKRAKFELTALRSECAALRAQVGKHQQDDQLRAAEYQDHYAQLQAQIQLQAQSQARAQEESVARRNSNPLPPPPRPVDISFMKPLQARTTLWPKGEFDKAERGKGKGSPPIKARGDDPMSSVFVPTLAANIPSHPSSRQEHSDSEGHSEVITLVYKPPRQVPSWEEQQHSSHSSDSDTANVDLQDPIYVSQTGPSNKAALPRADNVSKQPKQPQYVGTRDSYPYVDRASRHAIHHDQPRGHGDSASPVRFPVWGERPRSFAAETGTLSRRPVGQVGNTIERSVRRASSPVILEAGTPSDRVKQREREDSSPRRASPIRAQTVYMPNAQEAARQQHRAL
ncbi:hypothetical protein BU17DRAFT_100284 [Hysterangium stoloniferum]|nr:hypothetical protein BU17DRAFT_100284 [Hysterangium stoloniferum]